MTLIIRGTPYQAVEAAKSWDIQLLGPQEQGHTTVAIAEASPLALNAWFAEYRHIPFPTGALLLWFHTPDFPLDGGIF